MSGKTIGHCQKNSLVRLRVQTSDRRMSHSCWHQGILVGLDGHLNANEKLPRRRFDRAGVTCHRSGSGKIEAVCIHHFDPGGNEVTHEFFAAVILSIDLGIGAENRV